MFVVVLYRQSIHYEHTDAGSAGNQRVHTQEDCTLIGHFRHHPQGNKASQSFRPFLGSLSQPGKIFFGNIVEGGSRYATRAFATPIFVASATPIFVASATPYFLISATQTAATPKILF